MFTKMAYALVKGVVLTIWMMWIVNARDSPYLPVSVVTVVGESKPMAGLAYRQSPRSVVTVVGESKPMAGLAYRQSPRQIVHDRVVVAVADEQDCE